MEWLTRLINNIPKYINDVWYNKSVWIEEEKYPVIYDSEGKYINCEVGIKVIMGKTKIGNDIYYTVVKTWQTSGGDFIYPSDAINCKLKFSHIAPPHSPKEVKL